MHKGFIRAGHLPTLFAVFLYVDISFMVWVLLGPLGVAIARQLHPDPGQKGLMVATPVLAGASFAVALPLASAWYPPDHQGTALGIAGARNSGTVLAVLFAPMLAIALGWQSVIGLAAAPPTLTLIAFAILAKDSPSLGYAKQITGSYGPGFLVLAILAALALVGISGVGRRWRTTWSDLHGAARIQAGAAS